MSKVVGIYVKFWHFYNARSPKMAMSRDPRSKFRKKFYFLLILHLILEKYAKFLVEKLSTSEVISQKPPPVFLGLTGYLHHVTDIRGNWLHVPTPFDLCYITLDTPGAFSGSR